MSALKKKLERYVALDKQGEDYPECPRCEGSRYVWAASEESIASTNPVLEQFPCPLCVLMGTISMKDALEWIREQMFRAGEEDDEEEDEEGWVEG